MRINQVLMTVSRGDAISEEALFMRRIFLKWGYSSDILARNADYGLSGEVKIVKNFAGEKADITILHVGDTSICSGLSSVKGKKILLYHNLNVVPGLFFSSKGRDKQVSDELRVLTGQKAIFSKALADSDFNRKELLGLGYSNAEVLPVMLDFERYNEESEQLKNVISDKTAPRILFVGRVVPNKMIEDLLVLFFNYLKIINGNSRLVIAGDYEKTGSFRYYRVLKKMIDEMGIGNVTFTGKVDFKSLVGYYRWSNLFITMSRHEGFCVPLVESMYFGLPIIANNSCAIPETLGGSGILVKEKNFTELAEIIQLCVEDGDFRDKIIAGEKKRLEEFSPEKTENKLKEIIQSLV